MDPTARLCDPVRLSTLFGALALGCLPTACLPYTDNPCAPMNEPATRRDLTPDEQQSLLAHCAQYCPDDATKTLVDCTLEVAVPSMTCRYRHPDGRALSEREGEIEVAKVALPQGRTDGAAYCGEVCKTASTTDPHGTCQIGVEEGLQCYKQTMHCLGVGRRPRRGRRLAHGEASAPAVGRYFDVISALERASITAFEELADDLDRLGAPDGVRAGTRRAIRDERRHTRLTAGVARAFGGRPQRQQTASDAPSTAETAASLLERVARENAREGCVREAFGALFATYQANAARDPRVAEVMTEIAADETRHAALSFQIHAWAMPRLSPAARRRVRAAQRRAVVQFASELEARGSVDAELARVAGCPDRATTLALFRAFRAACGGADATPAASR